MVLYHRLCRVRFAISQLPWQACKDGAGKMIVGGGEIEGGFASSKSIPKLDFSYFASLGGL